MKYFDLAILVKGITMDEEKEFKPEERPEQEAQINQQQINFMMEQMRSDQNMAGALLGGLAAATVGAAIWATITDLTNFQMGWMAVGVGFLVGFTVRYMGKGIDPMYGIIGAAFALLGCLAGNFFAIVIAVAGEEGVSFFELLSRVNFEIIIDVMIETFHPMDVLFYGIAVYEGYKLSFRQLTEEQLSQVTMNPKQ